MVPRRSGDHRHGGGSQYFTVKRWRAAFLFAFLSALPILFAWNRSPALLQDSDTRGILAAIRAAHDPLKWFRGDWPIANGFYRPVASLTFELDNATWGNDAAGYGLTNALLCFGCVLLLFWALREIADRPWVSASGAAVFALWHVGPSSNLSDLAAYVAWATLAVGTVRHRKDWRRYLPTVLTLFALSAEIPPIRPLANRMMDWIPGRTASTMTVFALAAIAAYARFERLRRPSAIAPAPTPETPPATRNTVAEGRRGKPWPWAVVAVVAVAVALGTYEQAVMLPAALVVVAVAFRGAGARPKWSLHLAFWSLLVVYLALRWALLPHAVSGYQHQQYSSTRTAFWTEMEYVFPPLQSLFGVPEVLSTGLILVFSGAVLMPFVRTAIVATGYLQARREPTLALVGWLGSAVAFAPMAWFKLFEHYHYWPMALRAAFVVALGAVALRLTATAWCPPGRPAPPRPRPAPGSLPRR